MVNEKDKLHFEFYLPGFRRRDVKVEFEEGFIQVTAKRELSSEFTEGKFSRRENVGRDFYYESELPSDADKKNLRVNFNSGILSIEIPRVNERRVKKYVEKNNI